MNIQHEIIHELDVYAEKSGVDASTVCRKATGNPRLRERLEARIDRVQSDVDRLRKFMMDNPPSSCSTDGALPKDVGTSGADFKGEAENAVPTEGAA